MKVVEMGNRNKEDPICIYVKWKDNAYSSHKLGDWGYSKYNANFLFGYKKPLIENEIQDPCVMINLEETRFVMILPEGEDLEEKTSYTSLIR